MTSALQWGTAAGALTVRDSELSASGITAELIEELAPRAAITRPRRT
ncbi:MAG: hypothetical protein HGA44_23190 [Cellulomonadaceae bacterium]|nr:hypothetical protein [Cellulomonadaceae bacterium]